MCYKPLFCLMLIKYVEIKFQKVWYIIDQYIFKYLNNLVGKKSADIVGRNSIVYITALFIALSVKAANLVCVMWSSRPVLSLVPFSSAESVLELIILCLLFMLYVLSPRLVTLKGVS